MDKQVEDIENECVTLVMRGQNYVVNKTID